MKIKQLFKNPFVIAGGIGLLVFLYMKREEQKRLKPKNCGCGKDPCETYGKKTETEVSTDKEEKNADFEALPQDFLEDVAKMDKEELKTTIKLNQDLAKRKKLSRDERESIKLMMEYLKQEYANR